MLEISYYDKDKLKTISKSDEIVDIEYSFNSKMVLNIIPNKEITLKSISVTIPFLFEKDDLLFLNGYQSWTKSFERDINSKEKFLSRYPKWLINKYSFDKYQDESFYKGISRNGLLHGYSYAYVKRDNIFTLIASIKENTGFTRIIFDTKKSIIKFEKDCESRVINQKYDVFEILFLTGEEDFCFDEWFKALSIKPIKREKKCGYTSWYNYYQNISEKVILKDLDGFSSFDKKLDIFQIDDGYEEFVGDWLFINKNKFPNGLKIIADKIKKSGYISGIWMAPFVAEKNSKIFKEHPQWFLYENDAPLLAGSNWSGIYILDFYNPDAKRYIANCLKTAINEWGFELLKLDFLYAVCLVPRKDKTRGEIMREAMAFLREVCGDNLILGCGVPLASAFGLVDFCRIGPDVSLEYNGPLYLRPFHNERPSTKNTLRNTIFRRQLDGRAFLNDPDVFILRDDNVKLSKEEKYNLGIVNGLFGSILLASDLFSEYNKEKKELFDEFFNVKSKDIKSIKTIKNGVEIEFLYNGKNKKIKIR